jgi:hypothetical protein
MALEQRDSGLQTFDSWVQTPDKRVQLPCTKICGRKLFLWSAPLVQDRIKEFIPSFKLSQFFRPDLLLVLAVSATLMREPCAALPEEAGS